ncbi:MAG: large ribosomal subunit protein uL5, partial [Microgenomates group bacterium]
PIGLKVTLRGKRMRDFLTKLFTIVLPRLRDFQGVPLKGFDGRGNYSLGIPEQIVFPEIDYSKISKIRGLEITIVTNTHSDEKAKELLERLGMPFEKVKS